MGVAVFADIYGIHFELRFFDSEKLELEESRKRDWATQTCY